MTGPAARPTLQVIVGSSRPGRVGPVIARWFERIAVQHGAFDVEYVDLAEVDLPLLDEPENPARGGRPHHEHTRAWSATVSRGDAYVFVTPEYNNGYNAVTKNAIDYLYHEWADKSVGIVSYGGNVGAGTRAAQALKHVFMALKAVPVHESVNIPFVYSSLLPGSPFEPGEVLDRAVGGMLDEIARREGALRMLRPPRVDTGPPRRVPDPALLLATSAAISAATSAGAEPTSSRPTAIADPAPQQRHHDQESST